MKFAASSAKAGSPERRPIMSIHANESVICAIRRQLPATPPFGAIAQGGLATAAYRGHRSSEYKSKAARPLKANSQSMIPTTCHPRGRACRSKIFEGLRSPWTRQGSAHSLRQSPSRLTKSTKAWPSSRPHQAGVP